MKCESTGEGERGHSLVHSNIRCFFFFLGFGLLPLDVGSIVTAGRDQELLLFAVFVESDSRDVLRVTSESSTVLRVLQNWRLVDANRTEVISCCNEFFLCVHVGRVDVCTISAGWEYTGDFPTQFASGSFPEIQIGKRCLAFCDLLLLIDVVEQFCISLINSSQVL